MRFLIKMAFWMTLAFVVLPQTPFGDLQRDVTAWTAANFPGSSDDVPEKTEASGKALEKTDVVQSLLATHKTISDIGTLCARNPVICETGKAALVQAAGDVAAKMQVAPNAEGNAIPVPTLRQAMKTELHP